MRKSRYQKGSVKKQRGRWIGMYYTDGGRRSKVLGLVKDLSKSDARAAVNRIVTEINAKRDQNRIWKFGEFVTEVYVPYYSRKWKQSTRMNNVNRVAVHLVASFRDRKLSSFRRDELQDLLDGKAQALSFSVVDHLRWDLKQIFDVAVAEGLVERNPALLLFTPREAAKPERKVMTLGQVQTCFSVLDQRERLIAKLAVIAGMRPGEIFALTWGRLFATFADIRQRVYRGAIDTPKTDQSIRKAALSEGL
jgi:integrase